MRKIVDLHTHTTASDGVLTPTELVKKAKEAGLAAIAITDHDQVAGIDEAMLAGEKLGVEIIPGMELSTYWTENDRKEFHILGYLMDYRNKELLNWLSIFQAERVKRAVKIVGKLSGFGYQVDLDELLVKTKGSIGMPHITNAILDDKRNKAVLERDFPMGADFKKVIETYLISGKPAYVEKAGFEPKEAIDLIHRVGGVAVLAHPGWDVKIGDEETLKQLVSWGIDGFEAIAPVETIERTRPAIEYFSKFAKENSLLIAGGSDYHGLDGVGAGLGLIEWGIPVGYEYLEKLREKGRRITVTGH